MKILLVGNYQDHRQPSMQRFAEIMRDGLTADGHAVQLVRPPVVLGHFFCPETAVGKWIGYIDRFILYPRQLRRQSRWADVVHICDQANAIYIPHLGGRRHLVTCHDVLAIRAALGQIPESPTGWTGRIYQHWISRNLRKAAHVACVSRHTAEELNCVVGLERWRITVVPNGLNYPYRPMNRKDATNRLNELGMRLTAPFFLHVGGNDWYKNRMGVLRIFAQLTKLQRFRGFKLVLAGKQPTTQMSKLICELELEELVVYLTGVSNEHLRALYSTAEALLFPSLAEGFGWPIIEAQACGCPVITSKRSPMLEISGNAAIFIDPTMPKESAELIDSSWERRSSLVHAGLVNAARYELREMIDAYLKAYAADLNEIGAMS